MLLALRSLGIAALSFASAACVSSDAFSRTPTAERERAVLTVVEDCASGGDSLEHDGTRYCLQGEALHVSVDDVQLGSDDYGYPGVALELSESDAARVREWSAGNVGRQIAVIVHREILVVATLAAPLDRHVLLNGGAAGFTKDEVVALRERLRALLATRTAATR